MNSIALKITFVLELMDRYLRTYELKAKEIGIIGISIAERLRDRGFDTIICFDDCPKHSKSYRQISLILVKIALIITNAFCYSCLIIALSISSAITISSTYINFTLFLFQHYLIYTIHYIFPF